MTLNTFHHTGQAEFNVTMGIPRMREVIMTASERIKTPMMTIPIREDLTKEQAKEICLRFYRLRMVELLETLGVEETFVEPERGGDRKRQYNIQMAVRVSKRHQTVYQLTPERVQEIIELQFIPKVNLLVAKEMKRGGEKKGDVIVRRAKEAASAIGGTPEGTEEADTQPVKKKKAKDDESDDDDDGEDGGEVDAELAGMRNKKSQKASYDDDDVKATKDEEGDDLMDEEDDEEGDDEVVAPVAKATPSKRKKDAKKASRRSSIRSAEADSRRGKLLASTEWLHDFSHAVKELEDEDGSYILFTDVILQFPCTQRKLLMIDLAEEAAGLTLFNSLKGIKGAFVLEKDDKLILQTDGVNFEAVYRNADVLNADAATCNDIVAILNTYGVEAARNMIASEVNAVFAAFGITSDARHLGLLADYMTFLGGYRPLNRMGIATNCSPFLKMSFETTATFLEQATLAGDTDDMRNPSACIVLGKPVPTGTGSFDVVQPLKFGRKR